MSTKTSDFPNWPKTANTALTAADVKSGLSSPEITTCYREAQKSEDLHNGSQDVSPDGRHHSAGGKSKSRRSLTERRNPDGGVRRKFGGRNKLVGFSNCDIALKGFGTIYLVSMIEHILFYEMI